MGNGSTAYSTSKNRYFVNLSVSSLNHTASEDQWRNSFGFVSQLLFDSTKGQMQVGEITFKNTGTPSLEDDIVLYNTNDRSRVANGANQITFYGEIQLTLPAKTEPLVTVHELGHYVLCIRDEYVGTQRVCRNDASTGECIMEWARGYGIKLSDDCATILSTPNPHVTNFCYLEHVANTENPQQAENHGSCWNSIQGRYAQMFFPESESLPENTLDPIVWTPTDLVDKYAYAILSPAAMETKKMSSAVKSALKSSVQFVSQTGDHVAIQIGSQASPFRKMAPVNSEELEVLLAQIDELDFSEIGSLEISSLPSFIENQFNGTPGSHHRVVMLGPGQHDADFSFGGLQDLLQNKRVRILGTTLGRGIFEDQFRKAAQQSKWIDHSQFLNESEILDSSAFELQAHFVQEFFASKPGYAGVSYKVGILGESQPNAFNRQSNVVPNFENPDHVFEIDVPVFLEQDVQSAFFVLNELESGSIEFSLIAPDGSTINADTEGVGKSIQEHAVSWYHVQNELSGRWIVKLRRNGNANDQALPFHQFVVAKNPLFRLNAKVRKLGEGKVLFQSQAFYGMPLDHTESTVEIFDAKSDIIQNGVPIQTLVLQRRYDDDPPANNLGVQISGHHYVGNAELESGDYIAIFRSGNAGQATRANNRSCDVEKQFELPGIQPIPPFSRSASLRFSV